MDKQYKIAIKDAQYKDTTAEYDHFGTVDSVKAFARNLAIRAAGDTGVVVYVYLNDSVVFRCEYHEMSRI